VPCGAAARAVRAGRARIPDAPAPRRDLRNTCGRRWATRRRRRAAAYELASGEHETLRTTSNVVQYVGCPADFVESLRPKPYHQVNCYCYVLGNNRHDLKLTPTIFSAESEMSWMLRVKARTGGRNTDRFGTRNIHGGAMMDAGRQYSMFTLLNDSYIDYMGVRITGLDLEYALMTKELFEKRYI
jgi:hypothetical protein